MSNWQNYHKQWSNKPLNVHSTGDFKMQKHFDLVACKISCVLKLNKNDYVLDIGCSSGKITVLLAIAVKKIEAIDYIPELINLAKQHNQKSNIQYSVSDANTLKFPNETFDKICCYNVLHMAPNMDYVLNAIREMNRVCKKNGLVYLGDLPNIKKNKNTDPNTRLNIQKLVTALIPKSIKQKIKGRLKIEENTLKHIWFDFDEFTKQIENIGFMVEFFEQEKPLHDWYLRSNLLLVKK